MERKITDEQINQADAALTQPDPKLDAIDLHEQMVSGWRQDWMTDEWLEWWMSLDHSRCTQYIDGLTEPMDLEIYYALPGYVKCHSLHCPDCGKTVGEQGGHICPTRPAPPSR